jgi:hypothetical protein
MITLFGQHGVADYDAWKQAAGAMSGDSDRNAKWGIVESSMYRMVDGSGVIVTHNFNDVESAEKYKNMMESAEVRAQLEQMGATLPATIWIAEEL